MHPIGTFLAVLTISLALAGAALAGGHGASKASKAKPSSGHGAATAKEAPAPSDPRVVNVPMFAVPVVQKNGRLTSYVYLAVNLRAKNETEAKAIKADLALIQDAFLRALHAPPLTTEDVIAPDLKDKLVSRLLAVSSNVVKSGTLAAIEVGDIVRAPL